MLQLDPIKRPTSLEVFQFFISNTQVDELRRVRNIKSRLFQMGACQEEDVIKNGCVMDDTILQGDKIVKIAGGFEHLIILTRTLQNKLYNSYR
jgi:hypothetical protein